ncbi:HalOD1 output domain-containing protein [Haloterrigena turkmenica]|uniref:HalOD1 output domain-containing protein n=1 Tax=Haloterrigena turkmenica TaxID=62320 RepID=UPI001650FCB1
MSTPRSSEDECHHIYTTDENRSLSIAIVEAVAEYENANLMEREFRLYDSINPSALNTLFQSNQEAAVTVSFAVSNSQVFLRDIGDGVEICVSDLPNG